MKSNLKITLSILLICFLSIRITAQKKVVTQQLLWSRYYLRLKFNENYQLHQELEERTYSFPWRQHQFVSRTQLERKLGKAWNTALGFTYFVQSLPQDPSVTNYHNQTELRPQFEIACLQKISEKLSLHHRYWLEFRYNEQSNHSFAFQNNRFRYKLELRYSPNDHFVLKAFDELHLNLNGGTQQNIFNQNRYGASIHYKANQNYGFELGYLNWFQQQNSGIDFYNRNIIRLTFHQSIDFTKHHNN
ncbi:DUF2490 domain-containing protein [Flavobacterium sp. NRK F10]|uniref:DUF2490 domain-containing protein n=1 Tax=Flavobacterium sp. NRK F10 TaxID=2954931 RepID=UPI0020906189|nr:DUF2490 domain-containing protein [Flavobacterium sp. NRK F10]MCO6176410.1 DUF2490 domain-containing protein [Flavobacterium sp. NRK F10]